MPSQINTEMNCWARSIFKCTQVHWIISIKWNEIELEQKCFDSKMQMDFNHNIDKPVSDHSLLLRNELKQIGREKKKKKTKYALPALFYTLIYGQSSIGIYSLQSKWSAYRINSKFTQSEMILNAFVRLITPAELGWSFWWLYQKWFRYNEWNVEKNRVNVWSNDDTNENENNVKCQFIER